MKYIKKPIPVTVEFASTSGTIQTLEGFVDYCTGDAIVTGALGERWPIRRATFESTYEPCDGSIFGKHGTFKKKIIPVSATQIDSPQQVMLASGQSLQGTPGDWIIQDDVGKRWVVSKDVFDKTYEPLTDEQT